MVTEVRCNLMEPGQLAYPKETGTMSATLLG